MQDIEEIRSYIQVRHLRFKIILLSLVFSLGWHGLLVKVECVQLVKRQHEAGDLRRHQVLKELLHDPLEHFALLLELDLARFV